MYQGEFVTIIGPNGAGKSTAMKAVAGLVRVSGGQVIVDDREITNHPTEDLSRLGLAFVPQTSNIFASLTIADNLRLGARALPRALAAERIEGGGIRLNGQPCRKPGRNVKPGDRLVISAHGKLRSVEILALGARRGPAAEAQALYADLDAPAGGEGQDFDG